MTSAHGSCKKKLLGWDLQKCWILNLTFGIATFEAKFLPNSANFWKLKSELEPAEFGSGLIGSQNGDFFSHVSTPGASMMQEMTTVTNRTKAYINLEKKWEFETRLLRSYVSKATKKYLARPEFPQLEGQTAQVVETQVPVRQQAKLLKLKMPPILSTLCQILYILLRFPSLENWRYSCLCLTDFCVLL